jgi:putative Mg2+ transporter-C (MgtC) family protein
MPDPNSEMLVKLALSLLVGGIVGFERELRSKSAGFRTLILICIGSTLFTIASISITQGGSVDRIAANIVSGIGFIGAGVIFKGDNRINGITTAATIWVTAALGMTIGLGLYTLSIAGCVLVLVVHFLLTLLEQKIDAANQVRKMKRCIVLNCYSISSI